MQTLKHARGEAPPLAALSRGTLAGAWISSAPVPPSERPLLVVQLSDPHLGAEWGEGDPVAKLAAAIESVRRLRPRPDAVIVTGDLADHASDDEYERVRKLLDTLAAPVHVLPGNHDRRAAMRRHFDLPGSGDEPVQYVARLDRLRLIMLDTTIPGEDAGALDAERLDWLDRELAAAPDVPTVIAMHHPPFLTGVPAWDELALRDADRSTLARLLERHPQTRRIVAGHLHRTITAGLAHVPVLAIPSTYVQLGLDFDASELKLVDEPAGFAVHTLLDGEVVSHVQPVA